MWKKKGNIGLISSTGRCISAIAEPADCLKVLCEEFYDSLGFETRPKILLHSIIEKNVAAIKFLINAMSKTKKPFLCDDCFQEAIKADLVVVGKKLILHGWHKPTEADYELSFNLCGNMWSYLSARRARKDSHLSSDEENILNLSDDGWDTDMD